MNSTIEQINEKMQRATQAALAKDSRYRDLVNSVADGSCQLPTEDLVTEAAKYGYTLPAFQQHVTRSMRRRMAEADVLRADEISDEVRQLKEDLNGLATATVGPLDKDIKRHSMTVAGKQIMRGRLRSEEQSLRRRGMELLKQTAAKDGDWTDWRNFNLELPAVPVGFEGLPTY